MDNQEGPQVFFTQDLGGGSFMTTTGPPASSLGAAFLMLLAVPFFAAHWVVDHYGWGGFALAIVALVALIWWLIATNVGRIAGMAVVVFFSSAFVTFLLAGAVYLAWKATA